jgi:iron complex outermembrane receptor protein
MRGAAVAIAVATAPLPTPAQSGAARVEVTGSAVRRIDAESALPVQVLTRTDIERSGATTVVDLLKKLPVIQGGVGESAAVGGQTYGFSGVSIHNVGENRTLVLLNGRRLASFGGQTLTGFAAAFDLNALPLDALERVEVLTDGASALYGSDAIAGVVNVITRRDSTEGRLVFDASVPAGGGAALVAGVSKGFGSLADDGFNVVGSLYYDRREALDASARSFARSGVIEFERGGLRYRVRQLSASPVPANVVDDAGNLVNPYLLAQGGCAAGSYRISDGGDDYCGYDYVAEQQIYPARERLSALLSGTWRLGANDLFADLLWTRTGQTSRIAPVPGSLAVDAASPYYAPYLGPAGVSGETTAFWRVADLGQRVNDDRADFYDLALGSRGSVGGWDYQAAYSQSRSQVRGDIAGYPGTLALADQVDAGTVNPFVPAGAQTLAGRQALAGIDYRGYWDGGTSTLYSLKAAADGEVGRTAAGAVMLGVGGSVNRERFANQPSLFAQGRLADPVTGEPCQPGDPAAPCDQRFGDADVAIAYSADRVFWGVYGQLLVPAAHELEVTLGARYDHYSDSGGKTTGQGSLRWMPRPDLLLRGSVGTGFRAPSVPQLQAAPQSYGSTSGSYVCTPALQAQAQAQGAQCRPGQSQYDVVAGGNAALKPETSRQATFGVRFEPAATMTVGADWWWLAIDNAFGQMTEGAVFADPARFPGAWTSQVDLGSGNRYLALNQANLNLGREYYAGVDFDLQGRWRLADGSRLTSRLLASYLLRSDRQLEPGGPYYSDIGVNDTETLGTVAFRWRGRWQTSWLVSAWTHTLALNFQSGYRDTPVWVEHLDAAGNVTGAGPLGLKVGAYATVDWQSSWTSAGGTRLAVGVLNLFDREPPLSISAAGLNRGFPFGYDDRYYDPRGRTFYVNASVAF